MKTSSLRSLLPILSGFLILVSGISTTYAILDTNENSLSDLWEKAYNDGELFSPSITAAIDSDGDGWSNEQEAAAGTNPFEANPPDGIVQPISQHIPATYLGVDQNGDPAILTPATQTIAWPTLVGKLYTLQFSPNLTAGTWQNVGTPILGNGDPITIANTLTQPDGSIPEKLFWKLVSTDTDQDGDGLTEAEEAELGTDPFYYDTDGDGLPDGWEMEHGLDPNDAEEGNGYDGDPDEDGLSNFDEWLHGTAPEDDDTDDDTANDGDEVAGGGDPGNAGDGGNPPPPDQLLEVPFAHGDPSLSYSEKWIMTIKGLGPDDHRTLHLAARDFGVEAQKTFKLRKWNHYEIVIDHLATDPEYLYYWGWPDYDWDAYVDSLPASQSIASSGSGTPVNNFFMVKDHWLVDNRTAIFTTLTHGDDDNLLTGKKAFLVPVAIRDNPNNFGDDSHTGVDNTSVTASATDTGHQDHFWIMAPAGGTNTVNGVTFSLSNDMHFKIPLNPSDQLDLICPNATPTPTTTTLSAADPGPVVSWAGTGTSTTENTPEFRLGTAHELVTLPIRVKTMKKRSLKVSVFPVRLTASSPAITLPTKSKLLAELHKVFGYQLNAWALDPDYKAEQIFNYDPDGDKKLNYPSAEHLTLTSMCVDTNADLIVTLIGGVLYVAAENNSFGASPPGIIPSIVATTAPRGEDPTLIPREESDVIDTMTHEMGHRIFGSGHPDENGGVAPLNSNTHWERRLMASGGVRSYSQRLIVKDEWDVAEQWLENNSDVRYRREQSLPQGSPTGNY